VGDDDHGGPGLGGRTGRSRGPGAAGVGGGRAQAAQDLGLDPRVDGGRRVVEQQQPGPADERPGQGVGTDQADAAPPEIS
jgi:hypothetical protein